MSALPTVLMYHSIADSQPGEDPFDLHVSPENFRGQIEALASAKRIVSLAELAAQMGRGRCDPDAVVVTFDDAYENNLSVAGPILRRASAPATLFVAPDLLARDHFWWDRLIGILATAAHIPSSLSGLAGVPDDVDDQLARLRRADNPDARISLALRVWAQLRRLDLDAIDAALEELAERFAASPPSEFLRPMRRDEVREAAATFEIGAHTMSHPALTQVDPMRLGAEVTGSKAACELLSGKPVTGFAYPFGDVNSAVAEVVSRHFEYACTTREEALTRRTRIVQIPRLHVRNWRGDKLLERIRQVSRMSRMPHTLRMAIAAARDPRKVSRRLLEAAERVGAVRKY
jgi:peptidoglycan/xylan/chitin deacetylase (PgdA/CDA1 family)